MNLFASPGCGPGPGILELLFAVCGLWLGATFVLEVVRWVNRRDDDPKWSRLPAGRGRWRELGRLVRNAIVGALAGLFIAVILVILQRPTEVDQIVFGSFLCALVGAGVGLGRAAVARRPARRPEADST